MSVSYTHLDVYNRQGDQIKGRLLNVTGDAIDYLAPLDYKETNSIHREAPKFEDLSIKEELLLTGIKVIDLLEPYSKGGKIGLFGGAGVGKTVLIMEIDVYKRQVQILL